jgi:flagellar biosynthesis regulator FlbT
MNRVIKLSLKILGKLYFLLRMCYVKLFPINMDEHCFKEFKPNCNFLFHISQKDKYINEVIKINNQD